MKRLIIFSCFVSLFAYKASAQKLYIWCPEEHKVKPRAGFLASQEVNIVLFDGRTIPSKSKVECESAGVEQALITFINHSYPSCKLNVLPDSNYYKSSGKGTITIKIGIASYQAGFGTDISVGIGSVGGKFSYGVFPKGEWNGLVSY